MNKRTRRLLRRWWWALALLSLAAFATLSLLVWNVNRVSWVRVREAYGQQQTINGVGRVMDAKGNVWEYGLWVKVEGSTRFTPQVMLRPTAGAPSGPLDPEMLGLVACLDYTGGLDYLSALASHQESARGNTESWQGEPVLEVTIPMPLDLLEKRAGQSLVGAPDRLRFYVDPETNLIRGLEVFRAEQLRASVQYYYNKPLPPGFRPQ
jgi:hypothetical protein